MVSVLFDCENINLNDFNYWECAIEASRKLGINFTLEKIIILGEQVVKFNIVRKTEDVIYQFPTRGTERYGVKYVVPLDVDTFKQEVKKLNYKSTSFAAVSPRYTQFTLFQ